jgi:hypothetical protein
LLEQFRKKKALKTAYERPGLEGDESDENYSYPHPTIAKLL